MLGNTIWLALGLLVIASFIPGPKKSKYYLAGLGWGVLAVYWISLSPYYYSVGDYVNVILTLLAAFVSFFISYTFIRQDKTIPGEINGIDITTSLLMATTAAAIGGISYFIFSEIPKMNQWLISTVTDQTVWLASALGLMMTRMDWNLVAVNGYRVEIILACTAIESIALFFGLIASVRAPFKRLAFAFFISVPVIYFLNLLRNVFVVNAYGMLWFGDPQTSFYIAHTVIAKGGSLIALFVISYAVLKILPEILDMIGGIVNLLGGIFKNAG
ncbi:MAG: archaeosortase A [Candidatus Methanoperedens sp.]